MTDAAIQEQPAATGSAKLVYILYLIGLVFGITGIIGVVMAYINKSDAPEWLSEHYRYQIRTFWMGAAYMIAGGVLAMLVVGYLILLFWLVWLIVRCVKGMKALDQQKAPEKVDSWFF